MEDDSIHVPEPTHIALIGSAGQEGKHGHGSHEESTATRMERGAT